MTKPHVVQLLKQLHQKPIVELEEALTILTNKYDGTTPDTSAPILYWKYAKTVVSKHLVKRHKLVEKLKKEL